MVHIYIYINIYTYIHTHVDSDSLSFYKMPQDPVLLLFVKASKVCV